MIRTPIAVTAGFALLAAACSEQTPATPAAEAAAPPVVVADAGCNTTAEHVWIDQETPVRRYTVEAHTFGPTCEQSIAVMVIRAREGTPLYTWSGGSQDNFHLKYAKDAGEMQSAAIEWIANKGGITSTASLPAWEATDGQPGRVEFPFMPESWIDKAYWDTLKSENLDMFCFTQGNESMNCTALRDGQIEEIGLQLFPG